jgi:hypothetical protein
MKNAFLALLLLLPSLASAAPDCTLESEQCISQVPNAPGVCYQEHLTYQCATQQQTCASYQTVSSGNCATTNTAGTQNQTGKQANPQNFNDAMKDLALLNAIKKDLTGVNPIRIFGGKYMNCVNPLASGIGLTVNCCNTNLKPGAHGLFAGCSKTAVKLMGYVRAGTAYQFAPTACDGGLSLFGSCIICAGNQQDYCVFDNQLAEIIQIKGREQLAALAAEGFAGAVSGQQQTFSYYVGGDTQTTGNWVSFPSVNGNQIWAWQWPGACQSPNANSNLICPNSPQVYFAYCNKSGCATPNGSESPLSSTNPVGDTEVEADASTNESTAISKYVVVTGSCANNQCAYTESAYRGSAQGGDAILRARLVWPLYVYSVGPQQGYLTQSSTANAVFWGQSLPLAQQGGTLPPTVNVVYDLGDVESSNLNPLAPQYSVALPTHITMTQNYQITGNNLGKITVFGGCDEKTNLCDYTFEVPATAHAKPWYTATNGGPCNHTPVHSTINCSGFTLQEFEELNLGKMHLGRVLLAMAPKTPSESAQQGTATSEAQAQANNPNAP